MYRCRRCHLAFRHPIKTEAEYEAFYARASETIWVSDALRTDQKRVHASVEAACPAGKVLDVGCYDGVLLASLDPRYGRYGVEASAAACEQARTRGVEIVAATIRNLPSVAMQFDVICAVDVIEHVDDPRSFVAMLAERLVPGGTLIISTGTLDALSWRFAGGLYWYCSFPEHISFITESWARAVDAPLGLAVSGVQRFAYSELDPRSLKRARRRFYRKVMGAKWQAMLPAWWPGAAARGAPKSSHGTAGLFEDHMIVCFRKVEKVGAGDGLQNPASNLQSRAESSGSFRRTPP